MNIILLIAFPVALIALPISINNFIVGRQNFVDYICVPSNAIVIIAGIHWIIRNFRKINSMIKDWLWVK